METHSNFISPIPTKSFDSTLINEQPRIQTSPIPSQSKYSQDGKRIPPLEELIDLCYKFSSKESRSESTIQDYHEHYSEDDMILSQFQRYVKELHCQENLDFLIEIFKYEDLYDSIFPDNDNLRLNTPSPKPHLLGTSNNFNQHSSMGSSTSILKEKIRHHQKQSALITSPVSKPSSLKSVRTVDNEPTSVFASTIDDLDGVKEANANIWDDLMEKELQNSIDEDNKDKFFDDDDVSDVDVLVGPNSIAKNGLLPSSTSSGTDLSSEESTRLASQWSLIIRRYIMADASDQINVSNHAYREIMGENAIVTNYHSPNSLWRAKNEVLQLIKENAYTTFCKVIQNNDTKERCKALGIPCSCYTASPKSIDKRSLSGNKASPAGSITATPTFKPTIDTFYRGASPSISSLPRSTATSPTPGSPQNSSPVITPVHSNSLKSTSKAKSQGRLRQLASPIASHSSSGSSSPSSLSAFLGHLKLSTGSSNTIASSNQNTSTNTNTKEITNTETSNTTTSTFKSRSNSINRNKSQTNLHAASPTISKTLSHELPMEEINRHKLRLWKNKNKG